MKESLIPVCLLQSQIFHGRELCSHKQNPIKLSRRFGLLQKAFEGGQEQFQVSCFPFPMTERYIDMHSSSPWHNFWLQLKSINDQFEKTHIPPEVVVVNGGYQTKWMGGSNHSFE